MGKVVVNEAYLELLKSGIKVEEQPLLRAKHLPKYLTEKPNKATEWEPSPIDNRYNVPKTEPKASPELIDKTIMETEIYRRTRLVILQGQDERTDNQDKAKDIILKAQEKQVAYGIDKYPEPLNANTWSVSETISHIIDESIDKLHYLVMLRIKTEQELAANNGSKIWGVVQVIDNMIDEAIYNLYTLVLLNIEFEREMEKSPVQEGFAKGFNDHIDAMRYAAAAMEELPTLNFSGADMDGDYMVGVDLANVIESGKYVGYKVDDIKEQLDKANEHGMAYVNIDDLLAEYSKPKTTTVNINAEVPAGITAQDLINAVEKGLKDWKGGLR